MERKTDILLFLELQKNSIRGVERNIDDLKESIGKTEKSLILNLSNHIKSDEIKLKSLKTKVRKSRITGGTALILGVFLSLKSPEIVTILKDILPLLKHFI